MDEQLKSIIEWKKSIYERARQGKPVMFNINPDDLAFLIDKAKQNDVWHDSYWNLIDSYSELYAQSRQYKHGLIIARGYINKIPFPDETIKGVLQDIDDALNKELPDV
ncbi:hypothetical protein [Oceanobacillus jeddahense]|uniref:hypothetical protein n=1 Tax=Oceanobacillus jeddahense TaxID=1462527 RepID=UPI0005961D69|nr:hypothetical protein [Oceanobacillus jeddahense]